MLLTLEEKEMALKRKSLYQRGLISKLSKVTEDCSRLQKEITDEKMRIVFENEITPEIFMSIDWSKIYGNEGYTSRLGKWFGEHNNVRYLKYLYDHTSKTEENAVQPVLFVLFDEDSPYEKQLDILKFIPFIKPDSNNKRRIEVKCNFYTDRNKNYTETVYLSNNDDVSVILHKKYKKYAEEWFHNCLYEERRAEEADRASPGYRSSNT